jgi:hypothetical protein
MRKPITGPTRVWLVDYPPWREFGYCPTIYLTRAAARNLSNRMLEGGEIIPGTFTPDKPKKRRKKS